MVGPCSPSCPRMASKSWCCAGVNPARSACSSLQCRKRRRLIRNCRRRRTSSLIKLYIEEPGTPEVERQFGEPSQRRLIELAFDLGCTWFFDVELDEAAGPASSAVPDQPATLSALERGAG